MVADHFISEELPASHVLGVLWFIHTVLIWSFPFILLSLVPVDVVYLTMQGVSCLSTDSWNSQTNQLQKGLFVALAGGFFWHNCSFPCIEAKRNQHYRCFSLSFPYAIIMLGWKPL